MKTVSQLLKQFREDRDIRQREIAELLEMPQSNYSRMENGKQNLQTDQLVKICKH